MCVCVLWLDLKEASPYSPNKKKMCGDSISSTEGEVCVKKRTPACFFFSVTTRFRIKQHLLKYQPDARSFDCSYNWYVFKFTTWCLINVCSSGRRVCFQSFYSFNWWMCCFALLIEALPLSQRIVSPLCDNSSRSHCSGGKALIWLMLLLDSARAGRSLGWMNHFERLIQNWQCEGRN